MTGASRPTMGDFDSQPFWEALECDELRIQCCTSCGTFRWPARAICNRCYSFDQEWRAAKGRATVSSWVRTHHVFVPAFADEIPYITVRAKLAEQDNLLMIGTFRQQPGDPDPHIGMAIEAVIERETGKPPRVCWQKAERKKN